MTNNPIQDQLKQPETQEAIVNLLANLPIYQKNLDQLGELLAFGTAVLQDQASIAKYDKLLRSYNIDIETVHALISLLEKLPRLNELIETLDNIILFAESAVKDEETMDYAMNSLQSYTDPLVEKGKQGIDIAKEIQQDAQLSGEPISIFQMMKWIKEPSAQQGLRYIRAALTAFNNKI